MRSTFIVGTNVVYARIQEYGGTIHAKNSPYLAFEVSPGEWRFAKQVTIPAQPYLRPAFDTKRSEAVEVIGRTFQQLVIARHLV